jgi:hypothetical protein
LYLQEDTGTFSVKKDKDELSAKKKFKLNHRDIQNLSEFNNRRSRAKIPIATEMAGPDFLLGQND